MEKRRQSLLKSLAEVKNQADRLLEHWSGGDKQGANAFIKEKLSELARRRSELEAGIDEADEAIWQIQDQTIKEDEVKRALASIGEIYAQLKPFERRELIGAVLKSARVNEREIMLEIYAVGEQQTIRNNIDTDEKVRPPLNWLLG